MDSGQGNGYDTLDFDDHAAVTRALHLQEDTFLACKVTAGDTYFSSFRKVQFFGLEVQEMVVVSTGNGYETLHLHIGELTQWLFGYRVPEAVKRYAGAEQIDVLKQIFLDEIV